MSKRFLLTGFMASSIIVVALSGAGCKKEEQTKSSETVVAPQPAAPSAAQAGVTEFTFDDGIGYWTGTDQSIKVDSATDQKHAGKSSLKISGTAKDGLWNFARSPQFDLEPGKKYKVSGWMFVESWDKENLPPLLKVGVHQDGKWANNVFTSKYDLKKSKTWQQVVTVFVAPKDGKIKGSFSLEKGSKEPISAAVYLDDLKIESEQ
jgi:hypothetical protein